MRVLFIGGTGLISTAVSRQLLAAGTDLFLLHPHADQGDLPGAHHLAADIHNLASVQAVLEDRQFDVVVDWVAFVADDVERDVALFHGRTKQYIFISSASVYQKPPTTYRITESTPLHNPYWAYSRKKIACELRLMEAYRDTGFPVTIVRPSHTYDTGIPTAVGGSRSYMLADRMLKGRPVIVHGDGSSLWVVTHSEDFARGFTGLLGNPYALGNAFHITTDEVLTWNQIYEIIAGALGVEARIVHIPSDFIAGIDPELGPGLLGDKTWSVAFDNSKIKSFVPGFQASIPFREGIRRSLAWFEAAEGRKRVDEGANQQLDQVLVAYAGRAAGSPARG
jgi:nucleoside-diphosphate-sugar epimerase